MVGIGDYAERKLAHPKVKAKAVLDTITKAYPGAVAITLVDGDATQARVREVLFKTMQEQATPNSLILVYFVGHGLRTHYYKSQQLPSELYLLLAGATQKDFIGQSIRAT
jgi:hypothetical protein